MTILEFRVEALGSSRLRISGWICQNLGDAGNSNVGILEEVLTEKQWNLTEFLQNLSRLLAQHLKCFRENQGTCPQVSTGNSGKLSTHIVH